MADGRERVWKLHEDGYRYKILREEYREIFLLRRKKITYREIGDIYQISLGYARQLFFKHMRLRRGKVFRYLQVRKNRREER